MKISIIGAAGTLGSATAYNISIRGICDELVLFDISKNHLNFHLHDLKTAVSDINDTFIRDGTEAKDLKDSNIVVMTASVPYRKVVSRRDYLFDNLGLIIDTGKLINKYCPEAIVITASNPIDPLNYAMYLCVGERKNKYIGYSYNDTMRFRMFSAAYLGRNTTEINGWVIGEHGEMSVPLFSSLTLNKKPIKTDTHFKTYIYDSMAKVLAFLEGLDVGHTTGWTSSVGLSKIIKAIIDNTQEVIPSSTILEKEHDSSVISIGMPTVIGKNGVERIIQLDLPTDEKEKLNKAINVQKEYCREIENYITTTR